MKIPTIVKVFYPNGTSHTYEKVDNVNLQKGNVITLEQGGLTTIIPLATVEKIEESAFRYL